MKIITRYVARMFLISYLILILVGIGLYVVVDLLVNLDEFTKDGSLSLAQMAANMADYYGCRAPLYLAQLGGPMMAIAAAFTLGMMLRNNEMTPLVAAGMPLRRLAAPILVCAVLLTALGVWNREGVIPKLAPKLARTRDDLGGEKAVGVYGVRDTNNAILTAMQFYPASETLARVFIIEPDKTGRPAQLIEADFARYDHARRTWTLERGRRMVMKYPWQAEGLGSPVDYELVAEFPLQLTPEQLALRQAAEWADWLSLEQMGALLQTRNVINREALIANRHIRLTQPLLQWLLVLLAVPFFLTCRPSNVLVNGGLALLWCGLFFAMIFLAQSQIRTEWAALVAWSPVFLFGPLAVYKLANVKT